MKKKMLFIGFSCLVAIAMMAISPHRFAIAALNGMTIAMTAVIPALFPFIFFTKLLFSVQADKTISLLLKKPMQTLFGVKGEASFVFVISLLSGYPVGAKSIYDLSENSPLNKTQASRMATFCSNSGPMFLLGTIGGMFLKNATAGMIVFVSHILGSLLNGLLFRSYTPQNGKEEAFYGQTRQYDNSLQGIMFSTVSAALNICGFITLFFIICEMIAFTNLDVKLLSPLSAQTGVSLSVLQSFLYGILEVTRGCLEISQSTLTISQKTVICTLLSSFGGLSIAFQSLSYLLKVKVSASFYFLSKITHALLSTLLAILLCYFLF